MNRKLEKDFALYGKDYGISTSDLYYYNKRLDNNLTPYVLEERQLNVTQLDVFSRLLMERIIWLAGPVDTAMEVIVQAQLMYLDSIDNSDITLHISSPGGSVQSGLGIIDVENYIKSDIRTINTGMCASMAAVLLGSGTIGKRCSLSFSRTMIHQVSSGFQGPIQDLKISYEEAQQANEDIFKLLGQYTNKTPAVVKIDADRDLWLSSQKTLEYGLIDEIITKKI
jgi:ATP-dependent Clp protease, protease subunit